MKETERESKLNGFRERKNIIRTDFEMDIVSRAIHFLFCFCILNETKFEKAAINSDEMASRFAIEII